MGWWKDTWKRLQPPKSFQRKFRKALWRESRAVLWELAGEVVKIKSTMNRNAPQKLIRERVEGFLEEHGRELIKDMDPKTVQLFINTLMSLAKDIK